MFGRILIRLLRACLYVLVGFRLFFEDAREVHRIRIRIIKNNINPQKLPYREMEKLRQVIFFFFYIYTQELYNFN